jgi:magnesium transporter
VDSDCDIAFDISKFKKAPQRTLSGALKESIMIRSFYIGQNGKIEKELRRDRLAEVLKIQKGLLWVDICAESIESSETLLRDIFGFHPLAVDDALRETHVPKVDDWGRYLYLVVYAFQNKIQYSEQAHFIELDIFLGRNFLVTYHENVIPAQDEIWEICQKDERCQTRGAAYLFYRLMDTMVDQYLYLVEAIDDTVDEIEDQVFTRPEPEVLEAIFTLKRTLLRLRRILMPQREVFNKLSRGDYTIIERVDMFYFRDIYDHVIRLHDLTESMRDLVGGALDSYLSVVNNRMNEVMKILTIITTLFMPLSFLTGFFGMNFFQAAFPLQAWTGKLAFVLTVVIMLITPMGMYLWMRRRAWM